MEPTIRREKNSKAENSLEKNLEPKICNKENSQGNKSEAKNSLEKN